jgi:hypothetical protein
MHRNEHKQKCNQQHKEINKWSNQQSCKLDEYDSDTKEARREKEIKRRKLKVNIWI